MTLADSTHPTQAAAERERRRVAAERHRATLTAVTVDDRRGESRRASYDLLDMLGLLEDAPRLTEVHTVRPELRKVRRR